MSNNSNHPSTVGKKRIIDEYLRLIKKKDVNALLNLFVDDATVYGGLEGKHSIKPFLDVVMIANDGLRHEIEFVKGQDDNKEKDEIIALVTFERGEKVQARCTFELASMQEQYDKRNTIRTLHIVFIE